jgi:translation initiation factor 2-alpha kinase 3
VDESLDVFALGIILFELLYKLETRMERQMVLSSLTCSPNSLLKKKPDQKLSYPVLPVDFTEKLDSGGKTVLGDSSVADCLSQCIMGMLDPDSRHRWSCKGVRQCLEQILSAVDTGRGTSPRTLPHPSINKKDG